MKGHSVKAQDVEETLRSLERQHKRLLEKNQNDLVRIRQSQAELKRVLGEIQKERGEWDLKEKAYKLQIEEINRKLALQTQDLEMLTKQKEESIGRASSELRREFDERLKQETTKSSDLNAKCMSLTKSQHQLQLLNATLTKELKALTEKHAELERHSKETQSRLAQLEANEKASESSSKREIDKLDLEVVELSQLLQKSENRHQLAVQNHEAGERKILALQKQLTINKQLVKSLQTIIKVKEFEIERMKNGD